MHRSLKLASLVLALGCCAPHEAELAADPPARERLAQLLSVELPPHAGREPIGDGVAVWLGVDALAVTTADRQIWRLGPPELHGDMLRGLYEIIDPLPRDRGLDIFADRRVSSEMVMYTLYTASRSGWRQTRLIGGTPAQPGALTVELGAFGSSGREAKAPFEHGLAADLLLEWTAGGVLATAQMRPAERAPFDVTWYEPAPGALPAAPDLPDRVPLRLAGAGPQDLLDVDGVERLAAALCAMNGGPTGVALRPLATTSYAELLAVGVAAELETRCTAARQIELRGQPDARAEVGVPVDGLRAHVLARVPTSE